MSGVARHVADTAAEMSKAERVSACCTVGLVRDVKQNDEVPPDISSPKWRRGKLTPERKTCVLEKTSSICGAPDNIAKDCPKTFSIQAQAS